MHINVKNFASKYTEPCRLLEVGIAEIRSSPKFFEIRLLIEEHKIISNLITFLLPDNKNSYA